MCRLEIIKNTQIFTQKSTTIRKHFANLQFPQFISLNKCKTINVKFISLNKCKTIAVKFISLNKCKTIIVKFISLNKCKTMTVNLFH